VTYKPKLIEVALPLLEINNEAAREKSIRHGHPSTLHLWWARRPLAAARAVIWASLVDDPSGDDTLTPEQQEIERERLFGILRRLVVWENSNDATLNAEAKAEIDRCFDGDPPPILDPFGGGGAIPLEAQRLGLTALSGDLNPVAVLIQKAMLEIPPRFAGRPPVNPTIQAGLSSWTRAQGLAADVEAYGRWMRDEAWNRIGHLYPDAVGPDGERLTPIAWIWARTVESPDPSWNGHVPLVASWTLANKAGKPKTWIEPIINRDDQTITYKIRTGGEPTHDRTVNRGNGTCIATGAAAPYAYIRECAASGKMGQALMAVVAEGRGRVYAEATEEHERAGAHPPEPPWKPTAAIGRHPRNISPPPFGLDEWWKLFTPRQLTALTTFSELLVEVRSRVVADAKASGLAEGARLRDGGDGAEAYADAVVTYLAFVVDKCADYWSTICSWHNTGEKMRNTFGRQAIPMTWDFAECNPFSTSTGNWMAMVDWVRKAVDHLPAGSPAEIVQRDARARVEQSSGAAISTDPPYYDNISYADLSDFFYVWLRKNLADVWPDECSTLLTPKADEMIANQYRAGSKRAAEQHFESGMASFMEAVARAQHPEVPATIYYAYKATETKDGEIRSTGWDTFLQSVVDAGFQVTATWPMRTELGNRLIASGTNALASSIVLACRPRTVSASMASRGEFVAALRAELPDAVRTLQSGNIAPVDIPQSTIGPGIGVFSRYSKVVESDGSAMRVSAALSIINDVLGEVLDGEEAEMDRDSRFALAWYAQYGYQPASSGEAVSLAQAKNTSLAGIEESGIGEARGGTGKFRLFRRDELPAGWDPIDDARRTVWESTQHLIAALERSESEAAELLQRLGGYGESARQLAYLLFKKATDKKWADEAAAYNGLIAAWPTLRATEVATSRAAPTLDFES
jgi:putative DNA methylase